jgi:hypothetical protein
MTDYQIETNTRRCAASGRDLQAGERVFSVLLDEGGKFVRKDFGQEAWQGPPPQAFSFWAGRVPAAQEARRRRIDDDLLLECFRRLEGQAAPDRVSFRYVLALLLLRRKRLKFEEVRTDGDGEVLCLRCAASHALHEVRNPLLAHEEMESVQAEVFKLLGWE